MTYHELLKLYRQGKLDEEKRKEIERDIEKQDAISEYLFSEDVIPELEDLAAEEGNQKPDGQDGMEERFIKMVNQSIRSAFLKMGAIVGCVVLAVVLMVILVLPKAVSVFYYDPGKIVSKVQNEGSTDTTNQMSLDMAVYTELMLPGYFRDNVTVSSRGYGSYDISIIQNWSFTGRFYNLSGRIERGKLTLYDMNYLTPMTGNAFGWFQRARTDLSLTEQDEAESKEYELGEDARIMHGAEDREYMAENLEKLNDNQMYLAYVTLNEMMDYEAFLEFYQSLENLAHGWCAVKTNEPADENGYFRPENLGFSCDLSASTSCGWDKEKYPGLLLWETYAEDSHEEAEKSLREEESVKEHFLSMLRYMSDQKQFCEMMNISADFTETINYVEQNGITIYGFAAIGDKEALTELSKMEEVYVIDTEELR